MIGKILGKRYQINEKIDVGGMSTVYKALDQNLNRYDAIKILKDEYSSNPDFVEKFRQEANSVAGLNHPNIVNIYNVGSEGNINYIVMEYVKGRTLKNIIKDKGKLFQDQVVNYSEQIAKGLQHAHLNGIIHRDIKPQNIMITDDDRVKVTDFGIAKSSESSTITNSGRIIGSVHYFSPEQARGLVTDRRSDIYSLGIVMYEMITGKLPFDSESPVTIALKHMQEPIIPPKTINPQVSDKLNQVILKATKKDPNDRYQSMDEMVTDIQKIKTDENLIYAIPSKKSTEELGSTQVMSPIRTQSPIIRNNISDTISKEENYEYDEEDFETEEKSEKKKSVVYLLLMLFLLAALAATILFGYKYIKERTNVGQQTQNEVVKVPKLIGIHVDKAKEEASKIGLNLNIAGQKGSDQPGGTILEVSPQAGTDIKKGETINVIISSKGDIIQIPDVSNKSFDEAKAMLEEVGLKAGNKKEVESLTVDEGLVVGTNPKIGDGIKIGSPVEIHIAIPKKEANEIEMPELINKSLAETEILLKKMNLRRGALTYIATSDKSQENKVLYQSVGTGYGIKEGSKVDIKVGKYNKDAEAYVPGSENVIANNNANGTDANNTENYETTKAQEETKPENTPSGSLSPGDFVGKDYGSASALAASNGYSLRVLNAHLASGEKTSNYDSSFVVTECQVSNNEVIVNLFQN